jgi:NADPH:quinone reductase-like Zn-dependent oxidoreductase
MATITLLQTPQQPYQPTQRIRRDSKSAFASVTEYATSESTTCTDRQPPHQALMVNQNYQYELCETPHPQLGPHEILLRTKAVGLNPIDWKTVAYKFCMPLLPWINGRECAGVVEAVGTAVENLHIGQRVWTSTYYRDRRAGCFQERVVAPEHTVLALQASLGFEEAACLGVAGLTAAMTLWKWFDLPMSRQTPTASAEGGRFVLIWGGASITGQFAVQIAVEAGLKVIAVASQRMEQRLLDLGAHHVVVRDGRSLEDMASEVRQIGQDDIVYGVDLVGPQSATIGVGCLSRQQPAKFAPLAVPAPPTDVPENVELVNVEMKRFVLDPASRKYAERLTELVAEGKVVVPERLVLTGGLAAVENGLRRLRSGDNGGKKLVVRM